MSERKSWDVQRKPNASVRKPEPAPARAPVRITAPARNATPERKQAPVRNAAPTRTAAPARPPAVKVQSTPRRPASQPLGSLSKRRKQKRRTMRYVLLAIFILLVLGAFYGLWRPGVRIQEVIAEGPGNESAKQIVGMSIAGTYFHLIPKNSILFYPKEKIRTSIIDANPDVSAVSLEPTSFSSLYVKTTARAESFIWCGLALETPLADGSCYQSDIEGFIFKQDSTFVAAPTTGSSTLVNASTTPATTTKATPPPSAQNRSDIHVYGALDRDISDGQSPIRAHLVLSSRIPEALKFVDAVRELGAPVTSLVIRGDEADLWIGHTTRITYVLGHEKDAALSAASSLPTLSLTDGSIQYIDLRFPGKVYIKRYGQ